MTDLLPDVLRERLDAVEVPTGDLGAVLREGRARRRRRRTSVAAAASVVLAAAAVTTTLLTGTLLADRVPQYAGIGRLDLDQGLRAWSDGSTIHLGGRDVPTEQLTYLDTDAVATSSGVVYYDGGHPMLLGEDGLTTSLVEGDVESRKGFHPTAKADSTAPWVAYATLRVGTATITVRDLETGEDVASTEVDCGACNDLVIDALDDGVVFVREADGTRTWNAATGEWADFAGPRTRVADVRAGVVLHDGPTPTATGWRLVRGAIDSVLTFDGEHQVGWRTRLLPTDPDGSALVLDVPEARGGDPLLFLSLDTDGSVLVAASVDYPRFTVYDCEVPSGECEALETRRFANDPAFLGADM